MTLIIDELVPEDPLSNRYMTRTYVGLPSYVRLGL